MKVEIKLRELTSNLEQGQWRIWEPRPMLSWVHSGCRRRPKWPVTLHPTDSHLPSGSTEDAVYSSTSQSLLCSSLRRNSLPPNPSSQIRPRFHSWAVSALFAEVCGFLKHVATWKTPGMAHVENTSSGSKKISPTEWKYLKTATVPKKTKGYHFGSCRLGAQVKILWHLETKLPNAIINSRK